MLLNHLTKKEAENNQLQQKCTNIENIVYLHVKNSSSLAD